MRPVNRQHYQGLGEMIVTKCQIENSHQPHWREGHRSCQGREDQPAEVCPEEDNAGAAACKVHLLGQPGVT